MRTERTEHAANIPPVPNDAWMSNAELGHWCRRRWFSPPRLHQFYPVPGLETYLRCSRCGGLLHVFPAALHYSDRDRRTFRGE